MAFYGIRSLFAAAAFGLTACETLTSVEAPDIIEPEDYVTAAGATTLAAGAITQFNSAFGSNGQSNQVGLSGLIADELYAATIFSGVTVAWDRRDVVDPSAESEYYGSMQGARQRLFSAIGSFQQVAPDSSARIGQLFALLGYVSVFLGENYCAGVPLSHRDAALRPVYGEPLSATQIFDSAVAAFDSALVYAEDSARILNLARVGRARALLDLGRYNDAALAVTSVPTAYVYNIPFVTGTLNNGLFNTSATSTAANRAVTVPEREGTNGINWRTASDPRAQLVNRSPTLIGDDGVTQLWQFAAYQASNAPIRLAGGIEARLIEAEASLQAGDATTWLAGLNALRALGSANGGVNGLSPLADPGTAAGREDIHFRERAFWLFLTGHRHGDLRRLVRHYSRGIETVFPTGTWRTGTPYGAAVVMTIPVGESNNPKYVGCLNVDP